MPTQLKLSESAVALIVLLVVVIAFAGAWLLQARVEQDLPAPESLPPKLQDQITRYELERIKAQIKQIRSDTAGSLFWLKMVAVFVTVGGAVGGYLVGLKGTTRQRIEFEDRKNVDGAYQAVLAELAGDKPLLRAAAAVKLGKLLERFPSEWLVGPQRRQELVDLTKRVIAASLSIESEPKVLKALTIALVMHKPWAADGDDRKRRRSDCIGLDLSGAKAVDAYWARADFSSADFYNADLAQASLRDAVLRGTQFRGASLREAVLIGADCTGANFKLCDLRNADLSGARLDAAIFEHAKVAGAVLAGVVLDKPHGNPSAVVDISPSGDPEMVSVEAWLRSKGIALPPGSPG
ncbi:MAG TPA: pentapeptide repeat-containing protein [Burkholderiales bacterium]|nr:pentapeptide repeat-containing protein [Burkholderiales bacterium]